MVGSAGPTIVWSRAPRNSPSITAKRISSLARWSRPRAGSSAMDGVRPFVSGNASIWSVLPCRLGVGGLATADGRRGSWRGDGAGMAIHRDAGSGDVEGLAQRCRRFGDADELRGADATQDRAEELIAQGIELIEHLRALGGDADLDDAPVLRDARALDISALLDTVDETGRVRQGDVEDVGEAAHRHLAGALKGVEDVQLRHADAEAEHPLARRTLEHRHRLPEVGDDGGIRVAVGWDGAPSQPIRNDSSSHVNYPTQLNHPVNPNGQHRLQE